MMTTHRCKRLFAIAVVLCTLRLPAASEPSGADAAYEEGRRLYDLREWDEAIKKFKEAYRLRPDAKSLFNIAQAFRLKGDCVEAINFYRTYKRNFPREKNLDKVDKFIVELEPCAKKADEPKPQPKPIPTQPTPGPAPIQPGATDPLPAPVLQPEPQPQPQPERPGDLGRSQRLAGVAVAIGGGALFAGGIYFGLQAKSFADDVSSGEGTWDATPEEDGKSADTKAKALLGIGAAAVIVGVIVFKTAPKATSSQIGVAPHDGGALVTWSGRL
jgi:tetratricopeptide (TPR) repeat protein